MNETLLQSLFLLNRFLHIVCTIAIVGGTLFYGVILPLAVDDLKPEQQLSVFGRARWGFRSMVWTCTILLVLSGVISTLRLWHLFRADERVATALAAEDRPAGTTDTTAKLRSQIRRPAWWWAAHASVGMLALCIAVAFMTARSQHGNTTYLALLAFLLAVILLGTVARDMRLTNDQVREHRLTTQGNSRD